MRVLITGSSGQLGQSLQSITKGEEGSFIYKNSKELDITDKIQVRRLFDKFEFDYCINCAAYTAVDMAESEPDKAFQVNVIGVENLSKACLQHNVILIHISTDFVFDGMATIPYSEEDDARPLGVYGRSKLQGEVRIKDIWEKFYIIRTSWLYSEYGNNFMKTMLKLGKERDELSVVNNQFGTPTNARDLAKFILYLILSNKNSYGIYHYSNFGECSWYDFAKEIFKISQYEVSLKGIPSIQYLTAAQRPVYSVLSKQKVKDEFKIEIPNWKDSLLTILN